VGFGYFAVLSLWAQGVNAQSTDSPVDLTQAVVVAPAGLSPVEQKAVELLIEEVAQRTQIRWQQQTAWPADTNTPVVAVGPAVSIAQFAGPHAAILPAKESPSAEGFRLKSVVSAGSAPAVLVVGNDARGVLFGIGQLLRTLELSPGKALLTKPLDLDKAPLYPIRGHQLGYRPKTNSYDAWDLPTWERYIRDLAVFGCNAIELIPPRSDDDATSPHFPLPQIEMMEGMSRVADSYGLDVWIWYPAMDQDYSDPATVEFALKEWGEVFRRLPRIDALFVPTGDPGHTPPRVLLPMLKRQHEQLQQTHPGAETWISIQGFTQTALDDVLSIMKDEQPDWLTGIVYGPQTRITIPRLREVLPKQYKIRRYPDITHSMRCEYPVPQWDRAYAFTEAREVINPRPVDEATIFRAYDRPCDGYITYSEGCNDDVNKIVWSALGWDRQADLAEVLREYGRYFIGPREADSFAQGLLALERNWQGPLIANPGVDTTLAQFESLEAAARPQVRANWRFQQALYRAYYDAYLRQRVINETALQDRALEALRLAPHTGAKLAMAHAEQILSTAESEPVAVDLRARVFELAEALFQSIRMQLSVPRYQAIDVGRGANLDTIDVPLNDRNWLHDRFLEIARMDKEGDRLRAIDALLNWTNPGPGGFYDDLGDPSRQPHLVRAGDYAADPGFLETPAVGFHYQRNWRQSWCTHVDGMYETPVSMRYNNLDPQAHYKLRVVYGGDASRAKVRLEALVPGAKVPAGTVTTQLGGTTGEIHPLIPKPQPVRPVEFEIPQNTHRDGTLTLTWYGEPGRGGPGRGCQIAEVWLVKINPPAK
jgi:hypothetical protein